ncbi:MAG: MSMEG_0570 family nitrogen starvation response protein [Leptolyngbya sp. SIO4C1]|nr:MSMEG_0570 family nitrogen starvation response protein [Leptolyngbya sp. SIO4C1]
MPETYFQIQWPDGRQQTCYSPSSVIKDYFELGQTYTVSDFLSRARDSLQQASNRVQAKYGFPCSRALGQLQQLEAAAQPYLAQPSDRVTVLQLE